MKQSGILVGYLLGFLLFRLELTSDRSAVLSQLWLDTSYSSGARAGAFFSGLGLLVCQLAINTVDNAFSAGMDMAAVSCFSGHYGQFV